MLSKGKINMILGLCLTSIVSVGFSSWVISQDSNPIDIHGNIEVDNVINSKEYVYLDTTKGDLDENGTPTGIECFKYTTSGYLNDEGVIVSQAELIMYFIIDLQKSSSLFTGDSLKLDITLKYANYNGTFNIFKDTSGAEYHTLTHNIETSLNYENDNMNVIGQDYYQYSISIIFDNALKFYRNDILSNKIRFNISYNFFATTGKYFTTNIYEYMYKNQIEFSSSIRLTNYN